MLDWHDGNLVCFDAFEGVMDFFFPHKRLIRPLLLSRAHAHDFYITPLSRYSEAHETFPPKKMLRINPLFALTRETLCRRVPRDFYSIFC